MIMIIEVYQLCVSFITAVNFERARQYPYIADWRLSIELSSDTKYKTS